MRIYKTSERTPPNNTWVVAHYCRYNWLGGNASNPGGQKWKVVRFERGISKKEREELPDCERKNTFRSEDEAGNNHKPYIWKEYGLGILFGQDVDMWFHLPGGCDGE